MSFLTKFFIVLHVVLTMLVVSGLIVFVNRVENYRVTGERQKVALDIATRQAQVAEGLAQTALADATAVKQQAAAEVGRVRQQLSTAQTAIRDRDTQLATSQQNLSTSEAGLQSATAALSTAQKSVQSLQDQLTQTRVASDKTQQQNTELLTANADLQNKLQVTRRQFENANEEIDSLRNQAADTTARGGAPAAAADGGVTSPEGAGSIAINGVIRDRRDIGGVQYATISVGSADNVTKGMVFNVISRDNGGDFLGYLRVDRVEQNEATGRLEGPRVRDVQAGNEVRTQL